MQSYQNDDTHDNSAGSPINIIKSALQIAMEDFWGVVLTFAFLTIPPIWASTYLAEEDGVGVSAFLGLAAIVPQVLLTERALLRNGLVEDLHTKRRSYTPQAFGLSLIGGLGVLLGLLALVMPGLLLAGRWSMSLPVLIARDQGVTEALRTSWDITDGRFWFCFLSVLCAWLPFVIGMTIIVLGDGLFSIFVGDVIVESALSISMILSWFVAVALYLEIMRQKVDLTH